MRPSRDTGATDKAQSVTGRYRVAGSDRNRISFHVPVLRVCPMSMGHNYRIADGVEVLIKIPIIFAVMRVGDNARGGRKNRGLHLVHSIKTTNAYVCCIVPVIGH